MWAEDLLLSYQQDPISKKLLEQLLLQQPPTNSDYTIRAGIIRYKGKILVGNNAALRTKLIQALHSSLVGGHLGMRATYRELRISSIGLG